ncbi:MAG: hypothetical protein SFU25_00795 [Candidatus Caenarcaniphilales bacterium]|nr:hypothetical protein [Candidatus Caenarcaniphilales bacterium]
MTIQRSSINSLATNSSNGSVATKAFVIREVARLRTRKQDEWQKFEEELIGQDSSLVELAKGSRDTVVESIHDSFNFSNLSNNPLLNPVNRLQRLQGIGRHLTPTSSSMRLIEEEIYPAFFQRLDEVDQAIDEGAPPQEVLKYLQNLETSLDSTLAQAFNATGDELIGLRNTIGGCLIMIPVSIVTFGTATAVSAGTFTLTSGTAATTLFGTGTNAIIAHTALGSGSAFLTGQVVRTASGDELALTNALSQASSTGNWNQFWEALKASGIDIWRGASNVGLSKISTVLFKPLFNFFVGKGLSHSLATMASSTGIAFLTTGSTGTLETWVKYISILSDPRLGEEEKLQKINEVRSQLLGTLAFSLILSIGISGGKIAFNNFFSSSSLATIPSASSSSDPKQLLNTKDSNMVRQWARNLLRIVHPDAQVGAGADDLFNNANRPEVRALTEIMNKARDGQLTAQDLETVKQQMGLLLASKIQSGANADEISKLINMSGLNQIIPSDKMDELLSLTSKKLDLTKINSIFGIRFTSSGTIPVDSTHPTNVNSHAPSSTTVTTPTNVPRPVPTSEPITSKLSELELAQWNKLSTQQQQLAQILFNNGMAPTQALRSASNQTSIQVPVAASHTGEITSINTRGQQIYASANPAELSGQELLEFVIEQYATRCDDAMKRLSENGQHLDYLARDEVNRFKTDSSGIYFRKQFLSKDPAESDPLIKGILTSV